MKVKSKKLVFAISAMVFVAAIIVLAVIQKVRTDFLYNSNQVGDKIIQPSSRKISTIIVPHFDNFKTERQKFLDSLSSQNPQASIISTPVRAILSRPTRSGIFREAPLQSTTNSLTRLFKNKPLPQMIRRLKTNTGLKRFTPKFLAYFQKRNICRLLFATKLQKKKSIISRTSFTRIVPIACLLPQSIFPITIQILWRKFTMKCRLRR